MSTAGGEEGEGKEEAGMSLKRSLTQPPTKKAGKKKSASRTGINQRGGDFYQKSLIKVNETEWKG